MAINFNISSYSPSPSSTPESLSKDDSPESVSSGKFSWKIKFCTKKCEYNRSCDRFADLLQQDCLD